MQYGHGAAELSVTEVRFPVRAAGDGEGRTGGGELAWGGKRQGSFG